MAGLGVLLPVVPAQAQSPPRVVSIDYIDAPVLGDTYRRGERISVRVEFDRNVVVPTGVSVLHLTIGTHTRLALSTIERDRFIAFTYSVRADDLDTDGISIAANALTGFIKDASDGTTDAVLTHDALPADPARKVDGAETPYGVRVTPQDMTIAEGGSSNYTVVLASPPATTVTIAVARAADGDQDLTATPATLTFTASTWDAPQAVTVSAAEDDDAVEGTAIFEHEATSSDDNYHGIGIATVTATEREDDFAHALHLFPLASNPKWQGFARIINYSSNPGEVRIEGVDDTGSRFGPVTLSMGAQQSRHFNSKDLAEGNPSKGLLEGLGDDGEGNWRLRLVTELEIEPLAYIRTADGFVTTMHEVARSTGGAETIEYHVPIFNPADNVGQVSRLRLVNPSADDVGVTITGIDDEGMPPPGSAVTLSVPAGEVSTITAQQLEEGGDGFSGSFGDGVGKWRLSVTTDGPIEVMSLLESPTGHLANLSISGLRGVTGAASDYSLPRFSAASNAAQQGFARIINHSDTSGTVTIHGVDDSGTQYGPIQLSLGPNATRHFNSQDLESGNSSKGLSGGLGDGEGDWRLMMRTDLDIEPLAYIRTMDGFVTSMHEVVPRTATGYHVPIFNPGDNQNQRSWLRLVNPGAAAVNVAISGLDDAGAPPPSGQVSLAIPAGDTRTITARQLESGSDDFDGQFGDGAGKWQLFVSADGPIHVMSLLESPTRHLSNLSGSPGRITTSLPPGIEVSEVTGHTGILGEAAEFTVRLKSAPLFNVTISVRSTDESEGVPEQTELVFTPYNWNRPQAVVVRGTNPGAVNSEQNYSIMLGPSQSRDILYDGIRIDDVEMRGISLQVHAPEPLNPFFAGIEGELRPIVRYTGHNQLSFTLTEAPDGMEVDFGTGLVTWTPRESDAGMSFTVTLSATDGARFGGATFQVSVAQPTPVDAELVSGRLTVTDDATSLEGFSITARTTSSSSARSRTNALEDSSTTDLSDVTIEVVESTAAPALPAGVRPISDFFVIRRAYTAPVELRFPLRDLLPDADVRDVGLYGFGEASDVDGQIWSTVLVGLDFELSGDDLVIVISGEGLSGLYVFGIATGNLPATGANSSPVDSDRSELDTTPKTIMRSGIRCEPRRWPPILRLFLPAEDYRHQTCTYDFDRRVEFTIKDFGSTANAVRWGSVRVHTLVQWLIDAKERFARYGLGYDTDITVVVEPMSAAVGFVRGNKLERYRTLHLNDDNTLSALTMKNTAVHEYFHHAQGHSETRLPPLSLLIRQGTGTRWMTEGTARWFEDDLYDGDDSYSFKEKFSGERILETGLNSVHTSDDRTRSYQRFSFFKLVQQKCSGFDSLLPTLFSVNPDTDRSGIRKLSNGLAGASCNFGDHLGSSLSSSLASALVFYQYATQFENRMSLLDATENLGPASWKFARTPHRMAAQNIAQFPLRRSLTIPPAGASSMWIEAQGVAIPQGEEVEISASSDSVGVLVSVTSTDPAFQGTNTIGGRPHAWFDTATGDEYVFPAGSSMPRLFLTVANPSVIHTAQVTVVVGVRDGDVTITSHENGDAVNSRVVSVAGHVSREVVGDVDRVVVTSNGVDTEGVIGLDGSFNADVVVAIGDNVIEARAYRGSTPVTGRDVVNVLGVQSSVYRRNALLASRVAFVLRWNTAATDVDIYSTASDGTLWYQNLAQGSGSLDYDDVSGFGPEVISYRADDSSIYVNGTFDVDVHYYAGIASTHYTLDVILNETEGNARRLRKFESIVPLTESTLFYGHGPNGPATRTSRFNDIVSIRCSTQRICSVSRSDRSRVVERTLSSRRSAADSTSSMTASDSQVGVAGSSEDLLAVSPYERCEVAMETSQDKLQEDTNWTCNADGTKRWH